MASKIRTTAMLVLTQKKLT